MDINFRRLEPLWVLIIFTFAFAYIYPDLFFLIRSPMGGDPLTLKDPTVSWSAFMPAFREFRYELLEHGNLLWSNLRGMGQPILGNTVQGAPLFPLNLALLPLPDQLYWTVMPISRIILISLAAFIIARHIIGLSFMPSLLFALLIGFNTNTLRWMNHPWSNGLLAGLWYFYFLCRVCLASIARNRVWICLGLIVSIFAMVTTGFPEATVMSAIIVVILFLGFAVSHWSTLKRSLSHILLVLILCHLIGFALSAVQVIALLEFIFESRAMELRASYGGGSYDTDRLLAYGLAQLTFFGSGKEHQSLLTFSMGLWGLFFAIRGVITWLSGVIKPGYTGFAIAFLVSMIIFVTKAFGLSELLNQIFISTPILAQSHFPLYFSPMFFVGFAFFSALGLTELLSRQQYSARQNVVSTISSVVAIGVVTFLCLVAFNYFHSLSVSKLNETFLTNPKLESLRTFLLASLLILTLQVASLIKPLQRFSPPRVANYGLGALILALIVLEINNTVPKGFSPIGISQIGPKETTKEAIFQAYSSASLPQHELRSNDIYGNFVGQGLATVDNGVSAILPPNLRLLRLALFRVPYGGYFPLEKPRKSWSYKALSTNLYTLHATPKSNPNWDGYHNDVDIKTTLTSWPTETQLLTNPFFFSGRSLAHVKEYHRVSIWIHFQARSGSGQPEQNELENFWIEANIASQTITEKQNGRFIIDTPWRIHVPADWFANDSYDVTIRQIDPSTLGYHDSKKVSLTVNRNHPDAVYGKRLKLLSSSKDNTQHFFFDSSALPRAYIASACHQANTIEEEMEFYRRDDSVLQGEIIFPFDDKQTQIDCQSYKSGFQRVAIREDKRSNINFEPVQGPAILFLNDSAYPGWQAYDIGSEVSEKTELTIQRANSNGRSVFLPEARLYNVTMNYKPIWMPWVLGLLIMALALFLGLVRLVGVKRKT